MYSYIHIPFCRQKCPYCKFALTPIFDEFKKKRYIEYLKKEIREYFSLKNGKVTTIYFGWGTPSVLSHAEVREILECFPDNRSAKEISFESNPEDITAEYVQWLLDLGITRLSLGVQTLNNDSLKEISRSDKESIVSALESITSIDSHLSLNVDFILGLPHVEKGETLENIKELHHLFPGIMHTSVYMLEDEAYPKHWKSLSITEKDMQDEFTAIMEYFGKQGWNHYELSNFAKPWYESVHNIAYWNHSDYRGFWLSASSYAGGKRWSNNASFSGYYKWLKVWEELLTHEQIDIEKMMFGLRTNGVDKGSLDAWKIDSLITEWLLEIENNTIKPTKTWIFLLDYIMGKLV